METTQEAVDKLAALVEPAKWLSEHGYHGVPYMSDQCVIAEYLRDKTGIPHTCWSNVAIAVGGSPVTLPDHIVSVMVAFDRGDHPDLIA